IAPLTGDGKVGVEILKGGMTQHKIDLCEAASRLEYRGWIPLIAAHGRQRRTRMQQNGNSVPFTDLVIRVKCSVVDFIAPCRIELEPTEAEIAQAVFEKIQRPTAPARIRAAKHDETVRICF